MLFVAYVYNRKKTCNILMYEMLSLYVILAFNLCITENKEYTVVTKRLFCFL